MAWYVIYINASNERGEYNRQDNLYLKDPDFCRGADKPFQTYQKTGGKDAFLPWMTKHGATANAQADLWERWNIQLTLARLGSKFI
jgi:hypothetical protein